jgi:Na+-driven multidrug efflux pump
MPAMALGAAVSAMVAQNIGARLWDRVSAITRSGILYSVVITTALVVLMTIADKPVMALFMGGDSPALPIARHIHVIATWNFILFGITMVLFATVRANGAVWAPLIILCIGLVPVRFGFIFATDQWLGSADAIWWSFPVSSFANVALSVGYYLQGGWKKARMRSGPVPEEECIEDALGTREPGGALKPAG